MIRRGCRHPTHVELSISQCDQTVLPRSINTPTIQFGLILMMRRPAAALTTVSRKPECPQPAHTDTDTAIKPISISLRDFWAGSGLTRGVREPTGESDRTSPVQGGFTIWWKSKHVAGRRAARRHKKAFQKIRKLSVVFPKRYCLFRNCARDSTSRTSVPSGVGKCSVSMARSSDRQPN